MTEDKSYLSKEALHNHIQAQRPERGLTFLYNLVTIEYYQ